VGIGGGTLSQELSSLSGVGGGEGAVGKRELDGVVEELLDGRSAHLRGVDGLDVDDLDGGVTSAVTSSHIVVELLHGANASDVTELFVHVVDSLARGVAQPHTIVLHGGGNFLDLVHCKDLSVGRLKLVQLTHEVPEARASNNLIGGEETHAEHWGVHSSLSGLRTTNHHILVILYRQSKGQGTQITTTRQTRGGDRRRGEAGKRF